ncbi:ATP-binding protein, partial [Escherichia coli]|uniref:AlbA family DNA-binding domain-containing protein n=1 Tax=Escherichia coli TaxID=562 RepID=UPI0028DF1AEE
MLPTQESLTVEFKSERKRPQNDSEIVGNIVALANTQGGSLYLGIEDDGTVTGVSQEHENTTGLESSIFNKTRPPMRT